MRWPAIGVGVLVVATAMVNAGLDLHRVSDGWASYGPLADGDVPAFRAALLEGGSFDRADLEGKVSVLSFWASWCGVCKTEMPMYSELHRERPNDDVQVVLVNREGRGVSPEGARDAVSQLAQRGFEMPLAIDDGSMYRAFRASVLPHTVVVDRHGAIRHVHPGRVMKSTIEAEVAELLAED